jgi:poly(hydroxyalkanoate) depolymerase family esterase
MDQHRRAAMAEATRLTREGRLSDATALIQRSLRGLPTGPGAAWPWAEPEGPERRVSRVASVPAGVGELLDRHGGRRRPSLLDSPATTPASPWQTMPRLASLPRLRNLPGAPDLQGLRGLPGLSALGPGVPAGPPLPGQTLVGSFRGAAGERPYRLYVPSGCTGEPVPLVVMLHGGTQCATEFAAATRMDQLAEEHTFLVAYPEQVASANPMRCWNWFQAADQQRGSGEPSLIMGITARMLAEHPASPDCVYVAGFSAGAAMAAIIAAMYPDVYAAAGVHSGLAYGAAHDVTSAFAAMRQGPQQLTRLAQAVPVITFHGDADTVVSAVNAARVLEQFGTAGNATVMTTTGQAPGGRSYSRTRMRRAGRTIAEQWTVHGSGHAWSGGAAGSSYTDPQGPDASAEMVRFFAEHTRMGGG